MFIDGGLDLESPAGTNAKTVSLINALEGQAEHFVDEEAGHEISTKMWKELIDWLINHSPPLLFNK